MLNFLAYTLAYTISMNGVAVSSTTINNIPTHKDCVATGELMRKEMAKSGIRITYYCSKKG